MVRTLIVEFDFRASKVSDKGETHTYFEELEYSGINFANCLAQATETAKWKRAMWKVPFVEITEPDCTSILARVYPEQPDEPAREAEVS